MSDDAIAPDPVVRTALELLPVPEHDPGFWAGLDARLAVEPPRQVHEPALAVGPTRTAPDAPVANGIAPMEIQDTATGPLSEDRPVERVPDTALGLLPPGLRRRSNAVLLALALAAIVLVVVAGAALVRNRAGNGLGTTDVVEAPDGVGAATISSPHETTIPVTSVLFEAA